MHHDRHRIHGAPHTSPVVLGGHRNRPDLRGKSLDEQQALLSPGGAQLAPTQSGPGTEEQAQHLTQAIDKSTAVFDEERRKNDPYGEAYLDKHYRHHRNQDKKAEIKAQHAPLRSSKNPFKRLKEKRALKKVVQTEYEKVREASPDKARRMRNAELKAAIREEARAEAETLHPNDEAAQKKAYEVIWLRNYKLTREYAGGASEKEKIALDVQDELVKENNKKLKAELVAQAGDDPLRLENAKKIYRGTKGRTRSEQKEREQEQQAAKETAEEKQRKRGNAELKGQIKAKHGDDRKGKQAAQKEYLEKKTLTAKDQEKREAEAQKSQVKEHNKLVKDSLKAGEIDEKQAALVMQYVGDKGRKQKNTALKKAFSREDYRQVKEHRVGKAFKENKDVKKVLEIVEPLNTTATVGNTLVNKGVKTLSQNDAVTDTVVGQSLKTGGGQKFKMGGTTNQAAGILKSVDGITAMTGGTTKLVNAIGMRGDSDPANRERAKDDIVGGVRKIGSGTVSTATGVLKAVQGFTANEGVAAAMQLEAIPIVGIVGSTIKLIDAAATLAQASHRAHKTLAMYRGAKANKDVAMSASLKGLRDADLKLVTSSTVDVITASASIAAHGLTLGGVTAPAGVALKAFASGMSMAKSAAMTIHSSVKAYKGKKAQIRFDQAKKNKADSGEVLKSGKALIDNNIKYALQIVINSARDGDETALEYLRLFNLDTKNFEEMSNESIRKYVLGSLEQEEEAETLRDKLRGLPGKLRGGKRALRQKVGKGY